jgi:hypothetical protein
MCSPPIRRCKGCDPPTAALSRPSRTSPRCGEGRLLFARRPADCSSAGRRRLSRALSASPVSRCGADAAQARFTSGPRTCMTPSRPWHDARERPSRRCTAGFGRRNSVPASCPRLSGPGRHGCRGAHGRIQPRFSTAEMCGRISSFNWAVVKSASPFGRGQSLASCGVRGPGGGREAKPPSGCPGSRHRLLGGDLEGRPRPLMTDVDALSHEGDVMSRVVHASSSPHSLLSTSQCRGQFGTRPAATITIASARSFGSIPCR